MEFMIWGCKLCPHYTIEKGFNNDHCDCEGNCCDEGDVILKWDEEDKAWLSEDYDLRLIRVDEEKK